MEEAEPGGTAWRWGRDGLLLGAVLLLQLLLSLTALHPTPHTGGDNAGYLALANELVERGAYVEAWDAARPIHTKYPPLYPGLLAGMIRLGVRHWLTFKLASLLFTTLAVGAAFLWVRERRGAGLATGVAVLLALSDAFLWGSRWILSDPLFLFLTLAALWALERGRGRGAPWAWLAAGSAAAILAYFTRSAGLPLVVAVAAWLLWTRRWRVTAGFVGSFAVLAGLWWLRARGAAEGAYVSEFWMVDPYRPELGRVAALGLAERVWENLVLYVGTHIPAGLMGMRGAVVAAVGILLTVAAAAGWGRRLLRDASAAELFALLYLGLILLWPQVWSGDRFALPLYPLVLFYAGDVLLDPVRQLHPRWGPAALAVVAALALALPAVAAWRTSVEEARGCLVLARTRGPWGCTPLPARQFAEAARWSGAYLPDGAAVLSRKPRIFYVLSGVPGRTYPFTGDPDAFLATADSVGARYLVLDGLGAQAALYLAPVIRSRPEAFCSVTGFGEVGGPRTELLGILPPEERAGEAGSEEGGVRIVRCPPAYAREEPRPVLPADAPEVPLLVIGSRGR